MNLDYDYALILALQVALSLAVSLTVLIYLRQLLRQLLVKQCAGNDEAAAFWIRALDVMLVVAPLILVILFVSPKAEEVFRSTLLLVLIGQFIGVGIISRQLNAYAQREQQARLAGTAAVRSNAMG